MGKALDSFPLEEAVAVWQMADDEAEEGNVGDTILAAARNGALCVGAPVELLGPTDWHGDLVFRELVQHPNGSLGTKFPAEMIPACGLPLELELEGRDGEIAWDDGRLRIQATSGAGFLSHPGGWDTGSWRLVAYTRCVHPAG